MPKKTKKEKVIAELRRQAGLVPHTRLAVSSTLSAVSPPENEQMKPQRIKTNELHEQGREKIQYHLDLHSKVLTNVEEMHRRDSVSKETTVYAYISHDILRTIFLTLLAFVFEAMVYWLIQYNTLTKFF